MSLSHTMMMYASHLLVLCKHRVFEKRHPAPAVRLYGTECVQFAGCADGCPPATYGMADGVSSSGVAAITQYISELEHDVVCPVRYQQISAVGDQGQQPCFSICLNASQVYYCRVKVVDPANDDGTGDTCVGPSYEELHGSKWPPV